MEIRFEPIGFVHNAYPEQRPATWQGVPSQIHIEPPWCEALDGLEGFSHILVLCYLDRSRGVEVPMRIRAQRNPEMPRVGFWGTRTPVRPNPISVTVVPLIQREGCVLYVQNLDMFDGTAVLDIKPYLIRGDCQPEATAPEWIHRLWRIHDERES